jgi:hypothetical protein
MNENWTVFFSQLDVEILVETAIGYTC